MNFATMSVTGRLWWGVILPLLAGLGLWTLVSWLPGPWELVAVLVLCVGGIAWSIREIRWSKRVQVEIAEDERRMRELLDDR